MTDDERFFAWLDGELDAAEAAAMKAKVAADPALARLAEQHRALGARLRGAFAPIASAPVPGHLRAQVARPADVIDFADARRARSIASLPQWAAMAATLAIGILVGTMVDHRAPGPVEAQGGKLYAAAALGRALDTQLASAPAGDVRIGLTFRERSGAICRSFTGSQASGLACRDDGRWRVRALVAPAEGQGEEYRMAAGIDPGLAAVIDSTMNGDALDAAAEKAARDKGWR